MASVPGAGGVTLSNLQDIIQALSRTGAPSADVLSAATQLAKSGAVQEAAAAPSLLSRLAGGTGRLATGVGGFLGSLGTGVAAEAIGGRLFGNAPLQAASPDPAGKGFLTTTGEQLAIQQYVAKENFNRQLLNQLRQAMPGQEGYLPPLSASDLIESGSALKERELEGATERSIRQKEAEISARGEIELALGEMLRQAEVERARIAGQADVLKQREQSLGDVQRQRVQSGYQTASDLLSQTIKDVVARERYENNQALAEHAKAI
jgi:hypothetical protein